MITEEKVMQPLKLKKSVKIKKLKNGELLFFDKETGLWVKTSISFSNLGKKLQKGMNSKDLELLMKTEYRKDQAEEVSLVIQMLKDNELFENENRNSRLLEINKLGIVTLLISTETDAKKLVSFIYKYFKERTISMIFHNKKKNKTKTRIINTLKYLKTNLSINTDNITYRDYWEIIDYQTIKKLVDSGINNIQINFSHFSGSKEELDYKINFFKSLISKGVNIQLRYDIVKYDMIKSKQESLLVPVMGIPNTSYYFVLESILDNEIKRKDLYFKKYFSLVSEFYRNANADGLKTLDLFPENSLGVNFFLPIKRNKCGAGVTFFYIDEYNDVYSCIADKNKIGNLQKGINIDSPYHDRKECSSCMFLLLCGGICQGLIKDKHFDRICRFNKKYIQQFISNINLDVLKEIMENDNKENYEMNNEKKKDLEKRLQERILCPIGIF